MAGIEASYHKLESTDEEEGSSPHEMLVHVADGNKARWHHIEDLDSFFIRVYQYHQKRGFNCIFVDGFFDVLLFVFVVGFSTILFCCVDYDLLFANGGLNETERITIWDVFYPGSQCSQRIGQSSVWAMFLLPLAAIFWAFQVIKFVRDVYLLYDMTAFYSTALHIKEKDLENMTWHEVQQRLMHVQYKQQMCIHKQGLTELDIYNRILRFKNYMVAMVNKDVLPMRHYVPVLNEIVFFTRGLKYNVELVLFLGPWSLFASNYNLKEEYKRRTNREQLTARLRSQFLWLGIINLVLSPAIFVWQLAYSFFNYAELLKREPGQFGARMWSMYSRLYLRHFNELSHEFQARLNRGHKPATRYHKSFHSQILAIIAKKIVFVVGSVDGVLIVLAMLDRDVFRVDHILTIIAVLSVVVLIFRAFIPDENAVNSPELLMKKVVSQVHYVPSSWHGRAHTDQVRKEFSQLFQYKAVFIIEELLSPLLTPFILIFPMRQRAGQMIDFFRNFTVDITGVGDICSFAQMDVRRHGDPRWQVTEEKNPPPQPFSKTEGGKTELSLIHFAITNPKWKPSQSGDKFLSTFKSRAHGEALLSSRNDAVQNPLLTSLQSLESIEIPQASILQQPINSFMMSTVAPHSSTQQWKQQSTIHESVPPASLTYEESMMTSSLPQQRAEEIVKSQKKMKRRGGFRCEGSTEESGLGLISSIIAGQQGLPIDPMQRSYGRREALFASAVGGIVFQNRQSNLTEQAAIELAPVEMGISALYMHELYHNRLINEDRTAKWESVTEDTNSERRHDDSPPPHNIYRASERQYQHQQYPRTNPKQPLLNSSNSGNYTQNSGQTYLSFENETIQTMNDQPRSSQNSFMNAMFEQPSPRTYSDVRPGGQMSAVGAHAMFEQRSPRTYSDVRPGGQMSAVGAHAMFEQPSPRTYSDVRPGGQMSAVGAVQEDINLDSDSDEDLPETHLPDVRENSSGLGRLPPQQPDHYHYQPPEL